MPRVQGRIDQTNPLFSLDRFRANKRLSEMAKCVASGEHTFSVYKAWRIRKSYVSFDTCTRITKSMICKGDLSIRSIRSLSLQVSGINIAGCIPGWGQHATGYAGFHFRRAQIVQRRSTVDQKRPNVRYRARLRAKHPGARGVPGSFPHLVREKVMRNGGGRDSR